MTDFIEQYPNALSPEFCQQLIKDFEASPHKNAGRTGGGVDTTKKISEDIYLNQHSTFTPHLKQINQAVKQCTMDYFSKYFFSLISSISLKVTDPVTKGPVQLTEDNFEELGKPNLANLASYLFRIDSINAQKYAKDKGNYGYWHSEIFPELGENKALHRILLFLIYLNDVEDGGETDFYYQNKSIKPKAGTMVIAPCGFTHTHRGNVPRSNDKYVLTSWVLYNPAQRIYTPAI
ncbi:2OG-Fe(II) oxygenase [Thalassotalea euphylliae]|uniref:2OG-Fe(II) oxygenase n=1 Tax=Thalassotalea euphylliae TaxID=1655234 RepID=UPI00362F6A66